MTARLPKAILFDMDDTILCFRNADECWTATCNSFAARLGERKPEEVLAAIQEYRDWYWGDPERHRKGRVEGLNTARREIVEGALRRLGVEDPALAEEIAIAYAELRDGGVAPFPGAIDLLQRLRRQGVKLALITNGSAEMQRGKIEQHGLAPLFDLILIEGEFGAGKPDERVYRYALEQLGVTAGEVWIVGDNLEWEVAAPQRLGIFSIWFDRAGAGLPEGCGVQPDRIIKALSEIV